MMRKLIAALTALLPLMGQAEILQLNYANPDGVAVSRAPSQVYHNPVGQINFAVSAGLDRRIRLSAYNSTNDLVSSKTSSVIGATSRITVNGQEYFGVVLPATLDEGEYRIVSETLSNGDDVVRTDSYNLVIDVTRPKVGDFTWNMNSGLGGSIGMIGSGTESIGLNGISDDKSGIEKIEFYTRSLVTNQVVTRISEFNASANNTQFVAMRDKAVQRALFNVEDSEYEIGFRVYDVAGNVSVKSRNSFADIEKPQIVISDIFDVVTNSWVPYTPGMQAKSNPVRYRLRTARVNIAEFNPHGIGIIDRNGWSISYEGDYAFLTHGTQTPMWYTPNSPNDAAYWRVVTASGNYFDVRASTLNLTLASGVSKAPEASESGSDWMIKVKFGGSDEFINVSNDAGTIQRKTFAKPVTVDGLRLTLRHIAEYDVNMAIVIALTENSNRSLRCSIPVGKSYCDINGINGVVNESSFSVGGGMMTFHLSVGELNDAGTGSSARFGSISKGRAMLSFDFNPPLISDVEINNSQVAATFVETEEYDLATSDSFRFGFRSISASAYEMSTHKVSTLPISKLENLTRYTSRNTFNLNGLATGLYKITLVGVDQYDREVRHEIENFVVDKHAPTVDIIAPGQIKFLDELSIGLTDSIDLAPQITSINLRGGPAAENVFLSWRSESKGLYRLEYPVMFPSLEAGHSYTIEVKAADASGNIATATKTFMFSPDTINLNANGKISVPALGRPVRRALNEHVISSPEIRSNNVVISGSYELIVTLRSDAQSAAIVNGIKVSPGQTLLFPPYDFSATGGKIQLDVHAEDVTKTADMSLLIQTTQPGTPMLLATVTSFHEPLTYTTGTDAVQGIVPVSLQITKPGNSVCQLVSLQSAAAETFDPANPKCFLRSTSETSGAMSLVEAGNSQAGSIYINTAGTTTVGHKVVIYEGSARTEVVLQSFERQVEVKPAMGAITHAVGPEKNDLYHEVVAEKITLNNTAGFACNLVGSITEAKANAQSGLASLKCLVRWTEVPLGLQSAGSNLEGRFRNAGEQPVAWKTSVFTATGQEIVVQEGSDVLNVQTPPVPVPTDVDTLFGMQDGWRKGKDNIVFYSKSDRMNSIRVYAEARRYVQNVRFGSSSCQIPVGSVSCDLTVFYYAPAGVSEDGSTAETGFKREDIVLNTTTNYFANSSLLSADFKFDYRPPSVEQVVVGRTGEVVQINGASYPLSNDEILVVLKSPHGTMQTDRWKPASLSVAPIVQEGYEQSSVVNDGEESFLTNVPTISGVGNRLAQVGESVQDGTYFIYRFNSASVPDGMYVLDVVASDGNSNSGQRKLENVLLNRHAPAIAIFNQGRQIADKENVYFLSDLKVVAHGGWADGTTITKVLANSREIPMAGDKVNVKTVAATDFDPNQAMVLQVHATDAAGNEAIQNFNIQYMPVDFEFDGVPASLYQSVEAVRIGLRQTKGFKCKLATSDELAQLKSRGIYKGCTVEWQNLPSGLESIMLPTSFSLQGGIDALGDVEWGYKVFFHNAAGNKALAKQGSTKVTVVAADAPEFILSDLNKLEDGVYGVSYNSNKITRYELKTVPAVNVIKIKADNGEIDQEIILKQRLTKTPYSIRNDVKRPVVEGKMAWDKTTYHIDSFYQRNPQQKSSHTFDLITFPDGGVRAQLSLSEKEASAGNVILADLAVGRPIRGEFEYDIAKMGRWKAYLAIRENGAYTAVTNVVELTTTGIAKFELQAAELFNRADRVYAIAESVSQYEQYKRTVVSNSARLAVFQSDAIAGDIDARTTQGRVPFSASMRFEYDDKNDKTASAPVGWEMSADLQQWTDMGVKAGQKMYSVRITEVGVTYYRVRMQNKMTQELSYTAPLRVIGYETPDIWIEGPDAVYEGGQATLTLFSDETSDIDSDGFAEWSVDGGVTWTAGDTVTTVDVPSDMKVFARYRLNTTDGEVGDDGYRTAEHRITVVPVKPVVLKASGPKHAEVGSTIQLTGSARHDNRNSQGEIISSWLSPSGKNLPGATVDYVVAAEDVQDGELGRFQFVAYVQGLENETKASADVSIALWSYSLPEVKLALISRIQIAPATIAARVDTPYFYAPGVELSYEWLLPESVTVDRSTSSLTYLVAQNAGVQKIGIRVQDNRGNSKEIFEFVDIVEADPLVMGVELRPSNTFERAPVSYSAKTNAKPGHPDDSIASYAWLLDGVVLEGQSKPYANVQITEPGEYKLTVKFKTDFGQEGEIDKLLTVVPNKPPVCEPFITDTLSSITVNANCKDEDGKIISLKYGWREDGYESSGGTRLRFTKSLHQSLNVRIRATDDSGAETLTEIKWTNPAIVQP